MNGSEQQDDYFLCPHCSQELPVNATFCRACGASEELGWDSDGWEEDEVGYASESDFDYDDYVSREHGSAWSVKKTIITIVILLICVALVLTQIGW